MRFIYLSLALLMLIMTSGCWDYYDIEEIAIVDGLGIDIGADGKGFTITIDYYNPSYSNRGGEQEDEGMGVNNISENTVYSKTGTTIQNAIDKFEQEIAKKVFFGYTKIVVIGEDAARDQMKIIMEFFNHTTKIRDYAQLAVTPGRAYDVFRIKDAHILRNTSDKIFSLIKGGYEHGGIFPVKLIEFRHMVSSNYVEPVTPRVLIAHNDSKSNQAVSDLNASGETEDKYLIVSGMAAFKGFKLVGWLNDDQSRALSMIRNKKTGGHINLAGKSQEDLLSFILLKSKSDIKSNSKNSIGGVNINTRMNVTYEGYYSKNQILISPSEMNLFSDKLSKRVHMDIINLIDHAQKNLKSDILGFGYVFLKQDPIKWDTLYSDKWDDIFVDIPVQVKIHSKVINTGKSVGYMEEGRKRYQLE